MHFKINNTLPSFFFEKKVQYMLLSVEWIFLLSVLWTKYLETDVRTTRHSFAVVYYFSRLLLQTLKLSYLHMINTFITIKKTNSNTSLHIELMVSAMRKTYFFFNFNHISVARNM